MADRDVPSQQSCTLIVITVGFPQKEQASYLEFKSFHFDNTEATARITYLW